MNPERRYQDSPMQGAIPNYRRPFELRPDPNFASPETRRSAETILSTIQQIEALIAATDDNLESHYRNLLLRLLIGIKSVLMDEYQLWEHPEWYSDETPMPRQMEQHILNPATIDEFEKGLAEWGLEIRKKGR